MPASSTSAANRPGSKRRQWWNLSDAEILQMRFCDLKLRLTESAVAAPVQRLYAELDRRGLSFRPHVWLAEEWFSPDGVPGIAVPFFLAHPRLRQLERRMVQQVEGGNQNWLMRILRHEAGHAIDTAYGLRKTATWRAVFGSASTPYPTRYVARPGSRRFVQHLGEWYAQSHPTEDFAETFAVWLKPGSDWRRSYESWPARKKLIYVDELMKQIGTRATRIYTRQHIESLAENQRTLSEHYAQRLRSHNTWNRSLVDELLLRAFVHRPRSSRSVRAATLLRAHKPALVSSAVRGLKVDRYSVFQMLRVIITRADQLGLFPRGSQREALASARATLLRLVEMYLRGKSPQLSL
jgi:Putative zinc-binding metallo-peptidase